MKVKTVRQSGNPVDLTNLAEYEKEFKERYDEVLQEMGNDMKEVHTTLEMLDSELTDKYDTIVEMEFPKSKKAIKAFVELYGSYMISTHKDTLEPIMIIMDIGI